MKAFSELYNRLDETNELNLRINALVDYLNQANSADRIKAIGLLIDQRPSRIITLAQLKSWGLEASNLPEWLFEESLNSVGDVGETVSLVIPNSDQSSDESLSFWLNHIKSLSKMDEEGKKAGIIEAWELLDANGRYIFNKLITGGFRTTYPQILLTTAISKYTGRNIAIIADRLMSNWRAKDVSFDQLFLEPNAIDQYIASYPFLSAHYLEDDPKELGDPNDWKAEYKWDGIRVQVIKRNETIWVWTKNQELISQKTPELNECFVQLPEGIVLDGELLAFQNGSPLPLKNLKQRLTKKKMTKKILKETPLVFMAYDLLEHNSLDIRKLEWSKRRTLLEKIVESLSHRTEIKLSPLVEFNDWSVLSELLTSARTCQACGVMIKNQHSMYGVGRVAKDWWKWKVPNLKVKTVLLYAQSGGWGGGASNYTFAVWEGENLVPITKTTAGISKEENSEINSFVKKNTIERFGPVRSVKPQLVFELSFDNVDVSTRHKCGLILRNPSVLKWHKELETSSVNSLEEVKALLNNHE